MAQKKITDLQLIAALTADADFAVDNGIQTYRTSSGQVVEYVKKTLKRAIRTVSANDDVETFDGVLVLADGLTTLELPSAVGLQGKVYEFIHQGTNLTGFEIAADGSELIGESNTVKLWVTGETLKIVSNNVKWLILERKGFSKWFSWTPAITGLGTISDQVGKWRQMGNCIEGLVNWTNGTPTAALATIAIPTGLLIDPTSLSADNVTGADGPLVGSWVKNTTANEAGSLITATDTDDTLIYFGTSHVSSARLNAQDGNAIMGGGAQVSARFVVPIVDFLP